MRFNRNMPLKVIYGPEEYGGMEFPDLYAMQDQTQIPYLLQQLRWDKEVANDILTTLETIQIQSGFISPILESTTLPITYVEGHSFLLSLRQRMAEIDASMWIEDVWTPRLQRVGDCSLMEAFVQIDGITTSTLIRANRVRLYLRVVTIADLADIGGTFIPAGFLAGDWQAGSDILWPHQGKPTRNDFRQFRQCLLKTFCQFAQPNQPMTHSLPLDFNRCLGKWHAVPRNTWYQCYKSADAVYWRGPDGESLRRLVLSSSRTTGLYHFDRDVTTVPIDSHPITFNQVGESVWTRRPHNLSLEPTSENPPPGHVVENTLSDPSSETIVMGSDGSLHLKNQVASAAWIISQSDEEFISACVLLTQASSSYRIELDGILRTLHHLEQLNITPKEAEDWCDNERAVISCQDPPVTPRQMIAPDADVVLAIHHIRNRFPFHITFRHVYGHQDTRNRKQKEQKQQQNQRGIRIEEDEIASPPFSFSFPFEDRVPKSDSSVESTEMTNVDSQASAHISDGERMVVGLIDGCTDGRRSLLPPRKEPTTETTNNFKRGPSPGSKRERRRMKEKRTESPRPRRSGELPREAKINIACDELATETSQIALDSTRVDDILARMPPTLQLPYPGSKAMLKIGKHWVTSKYKERLHHARHSDPAMIYCMEKYGWDEQTFNSVYWHSIGKVRRKLTGNKYRQTCKIMHDWLPTKHMRSHVEGPSQCPGCPKTKETIDHMLRCPHHLMKSKREEIIRDLRKKGLKTKIPRRIYSAFLDVIDHQLTSQSDFDDNRLLSQSDFNDSSYSPLLQGAIRQQRNIGFNMMLRGFLAEGWYTALQKSGCDHPDTRMSELQNMIWSEVFDPLWSTRNDILFRSRNKFDEVDNEQLGERILWYTIHKHEVLSAYDSFLAEFDVSTIHRMSRRVKHKWVQHLDKAREAYNRELNLRASRQNSIERYLVPRETRETPPSSVGDEEQINSDGD